MCGCMQTPEQKLADRQARIAQAQAESRARMEARNAAALAARNALTPQTPQQQTKAA